MAEGQDAIAYFLNEHKTMVSKLAQLEASLQVLIEKKDRQALLKALESLLEMKEEFRRHFREEEKALFPAFEDPISREGGSFMVLEHPGLMGGFNELRAMMRGDSSPQELVDGGLALVSMLKDHSERENSILHKLAALSSKEPSDRVMKQIEALRAGG